MPRGRSTAEDVAGKVLDKYPESHLNIITFDDCESFRDAMVAIADFPLDARMGYASAFEEIRTILGRPEETLPLDTWNMLCRIAHVLSVNPSLVEFVNSEEAPQVFSFMRNLQGIIKTTETDMQRTVIENLETSAKYGVPISRLMQHVAMYGTMAGHGMASAAGFSAVLKMFGNGLLYRSRAVEYKKRSSTSAVQGTEDADVIRTMMFDRTKLELATAMQRDYGMGIVNEITSVVLGTLTLSSALRRRICSALMALFEHQLRVSSVNELKRNADMFKETALRRLSESDLGLYEVFADMYALWCELCKIVATPLTMHCREFTKHLAYIW